jgi:hypothetical protein
MAKKHKLFKRFSNACKKWPIVTGILIGICVAVFTIQTLVPREVWREYAFVPTNALSKPWTFVTSIFLHGDFNHLMFNLFGLAVFGYSVETTAGKRGFLTAFLLAGILSSFGTILTLPAHVASVGASGAIMGVLGFLAVIDPFHPVRFFTLFHHPAILWVILYGVINLVGLFSPPEGIGYAAHIGGLMAGISLGIHWRISKKSKS